MFEFEGLPPPGCPTCMMEREEQYQIVRAIVREFPGITAIEVHHITEVPMNIILRYINEGLLQVMPKSKGNDALEERIGFMIKKAKETRQDFKKYVDTFKMEEHANGLDVLHAENEQKFTWLEGDKS
jgi:hypothetical protein